MKWTILLILGFTVFSCNDTSNAPGNNPSTSAEHRDSRREPEKDKLTKEEALERARTVLLTQRKAIAEKLKVIDFGDYYTVTPELPPFETGGGWSVDVDSYSGEILKTYFTE